MTTQTPAASSPMAASEAPAIAPPPGYCMLTNEIVEKDDLVFFHLMTGQEWLTVNESIGRPANHDHRKLFCRRVPAAPVAQDATIALAEQVDKLTAESRVLRLQVSRLDQELLDLRQAANRCLRDSAIDFDDEWDIPKRLDVLGNTMRGTKMACDDLIAERDALRQQLESNKKAEQHAFSEWHTALEEGPIPGTNQGIPQ